MIYLKYLKYVIRHKWYVAVECFKLGLIWRGLCHDLSKFYPSEFVPYARYFYGKKTGIETGRDSSGHYKAGGAPEEKFNYAWLLHQKRNDHHWQWWYLVMDQDSDRCFPMSGDAILEMYADWCGAGLAIRGVSDPIGWYMSHKYKMRLHEKSRMTLEYILNCPEWDRRYFYK